MECENFISFQSAKVEIPQNICTLVYGINLDNEKQKNNGTGKSSIIEAIAFGLTGEPLRGVDKAEEIINDHSDSAHVQLELMNDFDNTTFTIDRTLFRKTPQQIECHKYNADGDEIDAERTVCPSVLEYNRYILSEIGLTKDDIYSNFILSDTHYKSFFDANDKTKKAMINRFSGADAVDKAIEKLQEDKLPAQSALQEAKDNKIAVDSKIDVINDQLKELEEKKEEYARDKEERIQRLRDKIADSRDEERNNKEQIKKANKRLDDIDEAGSKIEDMWGNNNPLSVSYKKISDTLSSFNLPAVKDYISLSKDAEEKIKQIEDEKSEKNKSLQSYKKSLEEAKEEADAVQKDFDRFDKENKKANEDSQIDLQDIAKDIDDVKAKMDKQWDKINDLEETSSRIDKAIREAHNMLHGAITCPKCKHEFFLDKNVSVGEVRANMIDNEKKLEDNKALLEKANKSYDKLKENKASLAKEQDSVYAEIYERGNKLGKLKQKLMDAQNYFSSISSGAALVQRRIEEMNNQINLLQVKISGMFNRMYQEAIDIIDSAIDKGERYIKTIEEKNVAIKSSIEAYEKSIEDIKNSSQDDFKTSLEKSLGELQTKQSEANKRLTEAQNEYDKYVKQENYFVEFRSYLANKKVEAIAGVTNYFLELIGSDLRVEMLGYKRLKNGAIRDKITVNLLRNGQPCGEFSRFSGGEKSRINIASILGLQKLTNGNAENGKGLEFLAADEVLDKADTTGIEAISQALNKLQVTSLIVTQNPVSDSDGHTLVVVKQNDYSTIKEDK